MLVLGDVGEMREEAEGADELQRLVAGQRVQRVFELVARGAVLVAAEPDRALPDALDRGKGGVAVLLTHRVAKDPAEEPDVLAQRQVLVGGVLGHRYSPGSGTASSGASRGTVRPWKYRATQINAITT